MTKHCGKSAVHPEHTYAGSDGKKIVVITCPGTDPSWVSPRKKR